MPLKAQHPSSALLQVEAGSFERVREGLARKYRNANMRPEQAAGYMRLLVLRATVWHVDAVLAVLDSLQPADVQVGYVPILAPPLVLASYIATSATSNRLTSLLDARLALVLPCRINFLCHLCYGAASKAQPIVPLRNPDAGIRAKVAARAVRRGAGARQPDAR